MTGDEVWIGKGSAIAGGSVLALMAVYSLVIFGMDPLPILAARVAFFGVLIWLAARLVAAGSLVVGPEGIRQVWPSRMSATWDEISVAVAQTERRLGHPNGVRPVIYLRDGRVVQIQLGSRRGGTASKLVDAVNEGIQHRGQGRSRSDAPNGTPDRG